MLNYIKLVKGRPLKILFILHGYGDSAAGIKALAEVLKIEDTVIIIPNAPDKCGAEDSVNIKNISYQWFPIDRETFAVDDFYVKKLQNLVPSFIVQIVKDHNIELDKCFLMGFSQGGFVASYAGLLLPSAVANVFVCGGGLLISPHMNAATISKPKFTIMHGKDDIIVSPSYAKLAADILFKLKIEKELHFFDGVGHYISQDMLKIIENKISV